MVLLVGSTPRILENLPQRPPTPPRESKQIAPRSSFLSFLSSKVLGSQSSPTNSPDSSAEFQEASSERSSFKKVEWAPLTDYRDPPTSSGKKSVPAKETIRPIIPSASQKPAKSILKPYNGVNAVNRLQAPTKFAAPHTYPSFAMMMESIAKQLAGEDRSSRLDAYMTLSGVLKATDNIPDPNSLKEKMGLLTQFIQRDMKAKTSSGTSDAPLINNALILLATLLFKNSAYENFPFDFCVFVVDHSTSAFEDPQVSKDVVKHLMFIIGQQNFSSKVMTTERAGRLIKSLHEIENHVKGKSIVLGRLGIYRKLLKQARTAMLGNTTWIKDLLSDMLSSLEDIRTPVLNFGLEAALSLGTEKQASKAVMDLFQLEHGEEKYAQYYARRLVTMVNEKQDAASVPRIWSTVVLFLRFNPSLLGQWEFMKLWMQTIQKCFNDSNHEVKVQANLAWNRLVFAIRLSERTTSTMVTTLWQPFVGQLSRKPVGKRGKEARQITMESICNLLYYAMRPQATFTQIDLYWDEYVAVLVSTLLSTGEQAKGRMKDDLPQACAILSALLDGSVLHTSKPWTMNRANEGGGIKAEELPSLDPRWIRKNAQRVIDVIEPLLKKCFGDAGGAGVDVMSVWKGFILSVASAGSKEIKVSNEAMVCVARMFTMFYNIWQNGPNNFEIADLESSAKFQASFTSLVTTAIKGLGILSFTEKLLAISQQDTFAVVSTPSNRLTQLAGNIRSPLHHLVILLSRPHSELKCDENFALMIKAIIGSFFVAPKPLWSRMEFAKDLVQLLLPGTESRASCAVWQVIADFTTVAIEQRDEGNSNSGSSSHGQPLGADFRNVVKILDVGIALSPDMPLDGWITLFNAIATQITAEAGDSGRAISLIEPLSKTLLSFSSEAEQKPGISYSCVLLGSASFPRDRQAMDAAQRRLWGSVAAGQPSNSFDPYMKFYVFLTICLQDSYNTLSMGHSVAHSDLLSNFLSFVRKCPSPNMLNLLSHIQDGLAVWIMDHENNLHSRGTFETATSVAALWSEVCSSITRTQTDSALLRTLEVLVCAGLESKHKPIVSKSIILWNSTFGAESELEYPIRIRDALLRLRPFADLELPSLPNGLQYEGDMPGPSFLDSQEDHFPTPDDIVSPFKIQDRIPRLAPSALPRSAHQSSPQVFIEVSQSSSRKRPLDDAPEPLARKLAKRELTPKLRHDDSQIQFAAIESSPLADAVLDSQILTDRQREVKERQQNEAAAMFPDLRSSPRIKAKTTRSSLALSSVVQDNTPTNEQPGTPTVELPKTSFDDFVTSSPTPHRSIPSAQVDSDPIDYPSSPPEQTSRAFADDAELPIIRDSISAEFMTDFWNLSSSSPRSPLLPNALVRLSQPKSFAREAETVSSEVMARSSAEIPNGSKMPQVERPATPIGSLMYVLIESRCTPTPHENFVDAVSDQLLYSREGSTKSENYVEALSSPHRDLESQEPSGSKMNSPHILPLVPDLDEESMMRPVAGVEDLQKSTHHVEANSTDDITSAQRVYPSFADIEELTTPEKVEVEAPEESDLQDSHPSPEISDCIVVVQERITPPVTNDVMGGSPDKSSLEITFKKPASTRSKATTRKLVQSTIGVGNSASPAKGSGKRRRTSARLQGVGDSGGPRKRKLIDKSNETDKEVADMQEEKEDVAVIPLATAALRSDSPISPSKRPKASRATRKVNGKRGRQSKIRTTESDDKQTYRDFSMDSSLSAIVAEQPTSEIEQHRIDEPIPINEMTSSAVEYPGQQIELAVSVQINTDPPEGFSRQAGPEKDSRDFVSEGTDQDTIMPSKLGEDQDQDQVAPPLSTVLAVAEAISKEMKMTEPQLNVPQATIAEPSVTEQFESFFATLKSAALTRAEAKKIKDMLWDVEGEIFAAEKRGRTLG